MPLAVLRRREHQRKQTAGPGIRRELLGRPASGSVALLEGRPFDNLKVGDAHRPLTYDPYVDGRYTLDYDWHAHYSDYEPRKPDWEILADAQQELYFSPDVDLAQVAVRVEDGVVRLTGRVDTFAERYAAASEAYEAGALLVDNDLKVDRRNFSDFFE